MSFCAYLVAGKRGDPKRTMQIGYRGWARLEEDDIACLDPNASLPPDRPSGSTRLAFDEAVFLANQGKEVWVITQDLSRSKPEYAFEDNLHLLRYASPQFGPFDPRRIQFHQARSSQLLAKYLATESVELIHGHSLLHYDAALSSCSQGARTCYSVHSPAILEMQAAGRGATAMERAKLWLTGRLAHNLERRCLERSHSITAESRYTVSLIRTLHGDRIAHRTRVVPGWVDTKRFQIVANQHALKVRLSWPTDVPVLFTLRRLVARMGLDGLLYALQHVKAPVGSSTWSIGGAGPSRVQLEGMISQLGLSDCVRLAGFVPDDLLPIMYAAADAFVLPTAELECFGIIVLESLACGRPVLATPVGAIPRFCNSSSRIG